MAICPNCGEENPDRFRLCGFCGTQLAPASPPQEVRKTVTVVFSDLKGSTDLGERLDSEALREVMDRYFEEMRAVLEHHGGTIEKFIGDAVMAIFGLPLLHEDDALRAVRAAAEMQEALGQLNAELEQRWGVTLTNRTGVNTGEVVAGDPAMGQRLVTGDAVNVAARLEQAAPANEILIGDLTHRLVRESVEVEAVEPLELKGKSERVPAFRLLGVRKTETAPRERELPIVGRERELAVLKEAFGTASAGGGCRLVTVLGEAGVGKSRLTEAFVEAVRDEAVVLEGRCLPYGRGITFWPLVEITRAAAGIHDEDTTEKALTKLRAALGEDEDEIGDRVASAVGFTDTRFPLEELFWGARKLFERLSARRPLVLVFEDIHWAESTLLDLIEHVLVSSREVGILILCLARRELMEHRPDWGALESAGQMALEPLSDDAATLMIDNLLGRATLEEGVRARITNAAEGNPLFVEQLLSMLIDDGLVHFDDDRWVAAAELSELAVPPTINALLSARLDRLGLDERAVIEPASVIGLIFQQSALRELAAETVQDQVGPLLGSLAVKQLVRPETARTDGEEAFRFQHILIRDAVYNGLLKRARATMHERFVDWAERVNRDRERATEFEEILGYHLEQAYQYLSQLGPLDDHGRDLGVRAAARLSSAGRRAFARSDMPAAANLLRRAVDLLPEDDRRRLELLPDVGEALMEVGEFAWAELYLDQAIEAGQAGGDLALGTKARLVRALVQGYAHPDDASIESVIEEAERSVPIFEEGEDDAGLAISFRLLTWAHGTACRFGAMAAAAQRAAEHASRGDDERQRTRAANQYALAALYGPTPVVEAIARCEQIISQASADRRSEGLVTSLLAPLEAMRGEFERARTLSRRARMMLEELGRSLLASSTSQESSLVEMLAGDAPAAERELRRDFAALAEMGEKYLLSAIAGELARVVCAQGRLDEALELSRGAEELSAQEDIGSQSLWRSVRVQVLAQRGDVDGALALATEALAILDGTDMIVRKADALSDLAEVLVLAGRVAEARGALEEAVGLLELKGNLVGAARARTALAELEPAAAAG